MLGVKLISQRILMPMKNISLIALVVLVVTPVFFADFAAAQSACANGVTAGSQSCGEDGPARNYYNIKYPGYGAFVYSPGAAIFYSTIGANETSRDDREREAMANCRAAGNSDCVLLGSWQNSCATVAKLTNAEGIHPLFAVGSNTRVSRREVRRACNALDPSGVCDIRRSHCIRPYIQTVSY